MELLQLALHDILPHIVGSAIESILDELQQCLFCLSFDVVLDLFELVNNTIMSLYMILYLNVLANLLLYHKFIKILVGLEGFFDVGDHMSEVLDVTLGFVLLVIEH